ncbi:hypothetical protein V7S57_22650 [Caulobacter sp. CCNWLY153]|uniref:hypothetical protein n=1 Tax=unclassified Caulobacter TaxID=2648921 RepID=UPI002FF185E9
MIFSLTLVLAIFLLAPGFAFVAGVYSGGFRTGLEASPPPPNSVITLALVASGALAAHFCWAGLYGLGELLCGLLDIGWKNAHPNPYAVALHWPQSEGRARGLDLLWALGNLVLLTVLTFIATHYAVGWQLASKSPVRSALYGWVAEATAAQGAIAHVVTNLELDGAAVGYEGVLKHLTLDSSKKIVSLVLAECELFTLVAKGGLVHHVRNPRDKPLPNIVLSGEAIRNVAFTPIGLPTA